MNFRFSVSRGLPAIALTAGMLFSGETFAAGFALNEVSMTGLGRAFAGAGVVGDDYSALAFNPAGITLKGTGVQAGAALILEHGEVKGSAQKGANRVSGKEGISIPVAAPSMFAQYKINDSLFFGLGIYAPFGLATNYDKDWFGSAFGVDSELEAIDVAPTLGYKINDKWSFGASFIARYGKLKMTNTLENKFGTGYSDFDIDGWNIYGRFGVMYEHDKDTRIGLSYSTVSTEVEQTLKGDHTLEGIPYPGFDGKHIGGTVTRLPESWLLSGYKKHGNFGYSASLRYTRWEHFNRFTLTSSRTGSSTNTYNWQNVWSASLGVDWFYNDTWTFRAGLGYDESPVRSSATRTVRIPDNDRVLMSLGFTYKVNDKVKIDAGYTHLYLPTFKAKNGEGDFVDAKYDFNAEVLGVQFQYDF